MKAFFYSMLFMFFVSFGKSQRISDHLIVKCRYDTTEKTSKGGSIEHLELLSVNRAENSQIVSYTFDDRHKLYKNYLLTKFSQDSFLNLKNKYLIDTSTLQKWRIENTIEIYIKKVQENEYKVIPDFNHSGIFTDDKTYFFKPEAGINDRNGLIIPYKINFWYGRQYAKIVDFNILPNVKSLPVKNKDAIFNTWGGSRKIMTGKLLLGTDSFIVKIFLIAHSVYYTKYNCLFSFSNPNENYIDLLDPKFPVYSYKDDVYLGDKIIKLDTVNLIGDTVRFSVEANPEMKGISVGSKVKAVYGNRLSDNEFAEVKLNNTGKKYTLLHFWGSWCGPCVEHLPAMKPLFEKYSDKVLFVGIPYESKNDTGKTKKLTEKFNLTWLQIIQLRDDPFNKPDIIRELKVEAFPTYILLDSAGTIIIRTSDFSEIEKRII